MMVSGSIIGVKERDYRESTPQKKNILRRTQFSNASAKLSPMTFLYSLTTTAVNCSTAGHPMSTVSTWNQDVIFWRLGPGGPDGYTFAGIRDIEEALLWNETKLRKPTLNLLEGEVSYLKAIDGPEVKQIVRFFTTMALTHSNASVFMKHYDDFYWYDFYDAPLGRPIGGDETKGVLYETPKGTTIEGLFIREFTNGWAV